MVLYEGKLWQEIISNNKLGKINIGDFKPILNNCFRRYKQLVSKILADL